MNGYTPVSINRSPSRSDPFDFAEAHDYEPVQVIANRGDFENGILFPRHFDDSYGKAMEDYGY